MQHVHHYRLRDAIATAFQRYGEFWYSKVTIVWDRQRGYLINIAHGPRA